MDKDSSKSHLIFWLILRDFRMKLHNHGLSVVVIIVVVSASVLLSVGVLVITVF